MKITGELLKTERIKKNYTVSEVANSLKLSSRIINSIESGDVSELPAKTFIRGFVKSYAQFLKLDADLILRQFLEEMGSTQPLPKVPPPQANSDSSKLRAASAKASPNRTTELNINHDSKKKTILYSFLAAGLLFIIIGINSIIDKYQKESVVDPVTIQAQALPPVEPILSPISSAEPSEAEKVVSSVSPIKALVSENVKPSAEIQEKPISEVSITTTQPSDFEPSSALPVELIVEAKKETEFFYAKGNTKNFTRVKLSAKEVHVIRSPAGLHLKSEDGSAFRLILNGIDKGQASVSSKPVRLTF